MRIRSILPCIALIASFGRIAAAQDEKAIEVLRAADAATRKIRSCSYDAEFRTSNGLNKNSTVVRGQMTLRGSRVGFFNSVFGDGVSSSPSFRATFSLKPGGSDEEKHLDIATDAKRVTFIDQGEKYFLTQDAEKGEKLLDAAKTLYMLEFLHPTPFSDEINGRKQKYEGERNVGEVPCDVVFVDYQMNGLSARWYFGREDHIPRRVDRIYSNLLAKGTRTLEISNLNLSPDINAAFFRPSCPPGFELRKTIQQQNTNLLSPGRKALPWLNLKRSDGTPVKLADYHGKVLVMEFWATWCGFCKATIPDVQALHDQYQGKPVEFLAISCWDDNGDPVAFMKKMKSSIDVVAGGDKVADNYGVAGLPTFFVINQNGQIVYSGSGAKQKEALANAINKALSAAQ